MFPFYGWERSRDLSFIKSNTLAAVVMRSMIIATLENQPDSVCKRELKHEFWCHYCSKYERAISVSEEI
jgi:hypothetical protein